MTRRTGCLRGRRCASLFFAGLTSFVLPAWALDCAAPASALSTGVERSQWEEFDAQGRSLLRETGTLKRIGLDVSARCARIAWTAQWTHSVGSRAYEGVTNTRAPVQTTSHLSSDALSLTGMTDLDERWAFGGRLSYRQINRDIVGTGTVLGFPERYSYGLAALGARYQTRLGERMQLSAKAWVGGSTSGSVWVQLPHADSVTLALGTTRFLESFLQLESMPTAGYGWSWQARLNYRKEATAAGAVHALRRNGALVGAAMQPEMRQYQLSLDAAMRYRF